MIRGLIGTVEAKPLETFKKVVDSCISGKGLLVFFLNPKLYCKQTIYESRPGNHLPKQVIPHCIFTIHILFEV